MLQGLRNLFCVLSVCSMVVYTLSGQLPALAQYPTTAGESDTTTQTNDTEEAKSSSNTLWDAGNTSINKGTADHIDIAVDSEATILLDGVEYEVAISLTEEDFTDSAVRLTALWNGEEFSDWSLSSPWSLDTSTGTYQGKTVDQIRVQGSFPVGTIDNPVSYTFYLDKQLTVSGENGQAYTVSVCLCSTFSYWEDGNGCPGLSSDWSNGNFSDSGGFDFALGSSITVYQSYLQIIKTVTDEEGQPLSADVLEGTAFTFAVYQHNSQGEDLLMDTVTLSLSSGSGTLTDSTDDEDSSFATYDHTSGTIIGYYELQVDDGDYYIVEIDIPETLEGYTYLSTHTGVTGTYQGEYGTYTTDHETSFLIQVDADSTPAFYFYNVYRLSSQTPSSPEEEETPVKPENPDLDLWDGDDETDPSPDTPENGTEPDPDSPGSGTELDPDDPGNGTDPDPSETENPDKNDDSNNSPVTRDRFPRSLAFSLLCAFLALVLTLLKRRQKKPDFLFD